MRKYVGLKKVLLLTVLVAGFTLSASADTLLRYNLAATTLNGISVTGTIQWDYTTDTMSQWSINLLGQSGKDSDLNNGVLFQDVGTAALLGGYLHQYNSNFSQSWYDSFKGSNITLWVFNAGPGTGLAPFHAGNSNELSELDLVISDLPVYSFSTGTLGTSYNSFFEQGPVGSTNLMANFDDSLSGTVTLDPSNTLPVRPAPEPPTLLLSACGVLLLAGFNKKRLSFVATK